MRVLISGASGFLGQSLTRALHQRSVKPVSLVRRPPQGNEVQWDPRQALDPGRLAGFEAVVHLAGKNVAGRWTKQFKRELLESRVHGTRTLATAAGESFRRTGQPRVFVSASGIGYYGDRADELLTEQSGPGTGFLAELSRQWEAATAPASDAGVRVVCLRIGVVLGRDGGALKPLLLPFRLGLGGCIGGGQQYWSWIGIEDVIGAMIFAFHNETLCGPVNAVAPAPVRNSEFVVTLAQAVRRPAILPFPGFAVRALLGEMGQELLLTSARALPEKLQRAGYAFRYSDLTAALHAILA